MTGKRFYVLIVMMLILLAAGSEAVAQKSKVIRSVGMTPRVTRTVADAPSLPSTRAVPSVSSVPKATPRSSSSSIFGQDWNALRRRSATQSLPTPAFNNATSESVQRAMSRAELESTKKTGLIRGGRADAHYVSNAVNENANRARQRLALPQNPEVKVEMRVPKGSFSEVKKVEPAYGMPGGGTQRIAKGSIPASVKTVKVLNKK